MHLKQQIVSIALVLSVLLFVLAACVRRQYDSRRRFARSVDFVCLDVVREEFYGHKVRSVRLLRKAKVHFLYLFMIWSSILYKLAFQYNFNPSIFQSWWKMNFRSLNFRAQWRNRPKSRRDTHYDNANSSTVGRISSKPSKTPKSHLNHWKYSKNKGKWH